MKLKTINYKDYNTDLPQEGKHILAQQTDQSIFVYQAFRPAIALYAVKHQKFGGSAYKFERMSWIKPNFPLDDVSGRMGNKGRARAYPCDRNPKGTLCANSLASCSFRL